MNSGLSKLVRDAAQRPMQRIPQYSKPGARIMVAGIGGGGNNTINRLVQIGIQGAECIAVNTDQQHLDHVQAHKKMLIGKTITRGLGTGGFPELGAAAAEESRQDLTNLLRGVDLLFIAAGLGGGTGTGAAPVIAEIAKQNGAIVVCTVTTPFTIEGARIDKAHRGLQRLRRYADTVIVIDNNKLLEIARDLPIDEAFSVADEILASMVKGVTETISLPSLINLDFADVRSVLAGGGVALVGLGEATQSETKDYDRISEAVKNSLHSPLLGDLSVKGATGALIHVIGGPDLSLEEATRVADVVTRQMRHDARIIWGARIIPDFAGYVRVLLIVTGLEGNSAVLPGFRGNVEIFEDVDWTSLQLYRLDATGTEHAQKPGEQAKTGEVISSIKTEELTQRALDSTNGKSESTTADQEPAISLIGSPIAGAEPLRGLGLKKIESTSSAST
ncbi:MAG: cell division protein FtsZ [Promethearchaeota archaeon]